MVRRFALPAVNKSAWLAVAGVVAVTIAVLLLIDRADLIQQIHELKAVNTELTTQNTGPKGADGDAGRPPTDEEISEAVEAYCAAHDDCAGPSGATGATGSTGPAGSPGGYTTIDIQCIGNHLKTVVNGTVARDLNVYCF